jgi:SAM-dependent methyltransferase
MPDAPTEAAAVFDHYAGGYDAALEQGLAVSGEGKEYFARGRVEWLAGRLRRLGHRPGAVVDFGCGTGSATPYLLDTLGADAVTGLEVSAESLAVARRDHGSDRAAFHLIDEYAPAGAADLAFCNGVFHHIPVDRRRASAGYVLRCLRPGGLFAFWENNPWNPGTRLVMSRIPFDRDAVTLSPPAARRLLRSAGFEVVRTDFRFIFPRALKWLRGLERPLAPFPLGAQYLVLARRPIG